VGQQGCQILSKAIREKEWGAVGGQELRDKPRQQRLCWLTLRDCLSFKVFFLQYTT